MFEIIDGFKKGFETWKLVWVRQMLIQIILGFLTLFVITPFGFLIAIFGATRSFDVTIEEGNLITPALIELMMENLGFWISVFSTVFILVIFATIITGAIQNIAHQRVKKDDIRLEDNFKEIIPLIVPLAVAGIVMIIIMGIPMLIAAEIFHLIDDPNTPIVYSFPLFDSTVNLTFLDIIANLVFLVLIILFSGPYFLAISKIVADKAGISSIVASWKLYFQKFLSVIIAMTSIFIIGLISLVVLFFPINGIVVAGNSTPTDLPLLFFSIFLLMIISVLMQFIVTNWLFTSLYCFYKELAE
ncbi:MAG: hypothetical protein ACFFAU_01715 [Candidatus Hodarchaeota archaeon]